MESVSPAECEGIGDRFARLGSSTCEFYSFEKGRSFVDRRDAHLKFRGQKFRGRSFVDRRDAHFAEVSWKLWKFRGQKFRGQKFRGQVSLRHTAGLSLCGSRRALRFECEFRLTSIRNDLFSGSALLWCQAPLSYFLQAMDEFGASPWSTCVRALANDGKL